MDRVKTGTLFSIVASLWLGFVGVTGQGCKVEDKVAKDTKQCVATIDEHYPKKAKDYCSSFCVRDYVKIAGSDGFRGRQMQLAGVISECEDREKNPGRYEGQVAPATRYTLGKLLDDAYRRGL